MHAAPPVPQRAVVPGLWHEPVEVQQPLGQFCALHIAEPPPVPAEPPAVLPPVPPPVAEPPAEPPPVEPPERQRPPVPASAPVLDATHV
jgi:hypothetical protein